MRRGVQIAVSMLAIVLLARPLDCFLGGPRTPEAMDCCLKGKCAPSAKSDSCCKNTVPGGGVLLGSECANHAALVLFAAIPASVSRTNVDRSFYRPDASFHDAPPLPHPTASNLPLLI